VKKPIPFGKYYLLERINVGGMAEVFKAKAYGVEGFERLVAVKRILPNIAEDKEFITMFIDEAKIAVQLNHANIAQIFDLGRVEDSYFIALEFVHGKDLRAIFDTFRQLAETMPIAQACFIIMKVCEGLDYAHNKRDPASRELNLVHRDISPQNILLSYEGEIKIIDFGIAKAAGKASKTQAGILKGKFGYMSPEQVRGMPLDRRSDIFSVGIVLYELLTGERLFVGESDFSTLEKVRNVEILPPSTYNRRIPEELERIVLKALARDVEDRYQNAIDLHDELQAFMYTAGEFYSRKDLASWMKRIWADEIEEETNKLKEYQELPPPSAYPPPSPSADAFEIEPHYDDDLGDVAMDDPFAADAPGGGPDLDWDDDEVETQLYDKEPTAAEMGVDGEPMADPFQDQEAGASAGVRVPKRTLMGMGAMNPAPSTPSAAASHGNVQMNPAQPDPFFPSSSASPATSPSPAYDNPIQVPPPEPIVDELAHFGDFNVEPQGSFDGAGAGAAVLPPVARRKSSAGLWIGITLLVLVLLGGAGFAVWYFVLRGAKKGKVTLKTASVTGLKVYLDGDPVDVKPGDSYTKTLEPGTHWVTAVAPGHHEFEKKFSLKAGSEKTLEIALTPLASSSGGPVPTAASGKGSLRVTTTPQGATVYLDGEEIKSSKTPLQVSDLPAGVHKVRITLPNYLDWPGTGQKVITVQPGKVFELKATLQPKVVMLIIKSDPKSAKLTILRNGSKLVTNKATPFTQKITPKAGVKYQVVLTAKGYRKYKKDVELTGQPEIVINAELEKTSKVAGATGRRRRRPTWRPTRPTRPITRPTRPVTRPTGGMGTLRINTKPWTKIYINGRYKGVTPKLNIKLRAGTYKLRLVNPEFGIRKTYTITITAGKTRTFVRKLSP
jgi:serine/threonine protein kinase